MFGNKKQKALEGVDQDQKPSQEQLKQEASGDQLTEGDAPLDPNASENFEDPNAEGEIKAPEKPDPNKVPEGCIELPEGVDLVKFVQDVYDLSKPQRMGHLHYVEGELPKVEAEQILKQAKSAKLVLSMDYVNGRACKMQVWKTPDGTMYIRNPWLDHTKKEFFQLCQRTKIKGVQIERDIENEKEIAESRAENPFATEGTPEDE